MNNTIPIVFTFDDNYALPAAVAIKSLVYTGKTDTWYDIYCLYNNLSDENRATLDKIAKIHWIKVDEHLFGNAPSTSEYPVDVYYRLAIHDILPQYDKILYSDVDVLFQNDLRSVYDTDIKGCYWAGVPVERNEQPSKEALAQQVGKPDDPHYMSGHTKFDENNNEFIYASGFMVINAQKMREDKMTEKFLQTIKQFSGKLKMFDLDVLNLTCQNNTIKRLSLDYCVFEDLTVSKDYKETNLYPFLSRIYSDGEIARSVRRPIILHYTGADPVRVWNRKQTKQPFVYGKYFSMAQQYYDKYYNEVQKLMFSESARILVLAPHPDDESIGCGGLLLKYGPQCDVVVLTDGRYGGTSGVLQSDVVAMRKLEMENAMAYAGVNSWKIVGIEDGSLRDNFEQFARIDVSEYDAIFCPAPGDNHSDHACVYDFLMQRKIDSRIFVYEVWSALADPSHYIDISDCIDEKRKLISYHESQIAQVDYVSKTLGLNCFRGLLVYPAIPYAEAYKLM